MDIIEPLKIKGRVLKVYDSVETSTGDPRVDFVIVQKATKVNAQDHFAYFSAFSGTALFVKKLKQDQEVEVVFDLRSFQNKLNTDKYFTSLTCRRVNVL